MRRFQLLSGLRGAGKTTILYQLIDHLLSEGIPAHKILYVPLQHPVFLDFSIGEIIEEYQQYVYPADDYYLFLDNIHYADNWDRWIKTLYDMYPKIKLVATGAADLFSLRGKFESSAGRIRQVQVPPLSFFEYTKFYGISEIDLAQNFSFDSHQFGDLLAELQNQTRLLEEIFSDYLFYGAFPEYVRNQDHELVQENIKNNILRSALRKDLTNYNEIRSFRKIDALFNYFCTASGEPYSLTKVAKEIDGISKETLEKYVDYLKSLYLIDVSYPNYLGRRIRRVFPKIYVTIPAIQNAALSKTIENVSQEQLEKMVEALCYNAISYYFTSKNASIDYVPGKRSDTQADIVVERFHHDPVFFKVCYQKDSVISRKDFFREIDTKGSFIVVTKNSDDFGIDFLPNGREALFIPASVLLYLIGYAEYYDIELF